MENTPHRGQLVRKIDDRGFGFIESGDDEYFVHRGDIDLDWQDVHVGMEVTFEPIDTPKGPRAVRVQEVFKNPRRL